MNGPSNANSGAPPDEWDAASNDAPQGAPSDSATPTAARSPSHAPPVNTPPASTPPPHSPAASRAAHADGAQRPPHFRVERDHRHGHPHDAPDHAAFDDRGQVYGALDLGTNNCRLLLARPSRRGFRVVDAFSRIIRLGEGVTQSGHLSDAAMERTVDALRVCAAKLARSNVTRARCVATEACRIAGNGEAFLDRVRRDLGLGIEILSRESEAGLAVSGCASLIDYSADYVMVFDIGGGSSELIWIDLRGAGDGGHAGLLERLDSGQGMAAWTSLPAGVVTLAERHGGRHVTPENFEAMVAEVMGLIAPFEEKHRFRERIRGAEVHFLGTSGTVTTVAGIRLGLKRYDRSRVDGCWLESDEVRGVTGDLLARSYDERVAEPCIGSDRADLVLAGCAILEAILRVWPATRLRVADRGLREGILTKLMSEDGVYRAGRRKRGGRR